MSARYRFRADGASRMLYLVLYLFPYGFCMMGGAGSMHRSVPVCLSVAPEGIQEVVFLFFSLFAMDFIHLFPVG